MGRIALSEYKEKFILKGGMLIAAMVGLDARTTMDLDDFLLYNWNILRFSPPVRTDNVEERRINPKRMQREISGQLQDKGIGTKAQQALKLQHEQGKIERKIQNREQKEAEKERQYALRQEKKKAKHRGGSILMENPKWIRCPACRNKTRDRIREDTTGGQNI